MKKFVVTLRMIQKTEHHDTVMVEAESYDQARLAAWDALDERANIGADDEDWNIVQVREVKDEQL